MSTELPLLDYVAANPWPQPQQPKLAAEFAEFHAENPHVYALFCRFTREAIASGRSTYSADAILHRLRWYTGIETRGDDYKINNNYSAFYARLFMRENPQHGEFFETRRSVADRGRA